jgi:hypothetical protein
MTSRNLKWNSLQWLQKIRREVDLDRQQGPWKRRPRSLTYREDPFYEPAPMPEPAKYRNKPPE